MQAKHTNIQPEKIQFIVEKYSEFLAGIYKANPKLVEKWSRLLDIKLEKIKQEYKESQVNSEE